MEQMSSFDDLISIIVPVYKTEEYLSKCINSILVQTYRNLEIILVDDGSPDNSGMICDTYAKMDPRIVTIHQKNMGSVKARKTGISAAHGTYATFVDSDDFVAEDYIEKICLRIRLYKADIVTYGFTRYFTDSDTYGDKYIDRIAGGVYYYDEIQQNIIPKMICIGSSFEPGIMPSLCCKMFRTELIRKYMLPVDECIKNGDDGACTYECILNAKILCICDDLMDYYYRMTGNSITQGVDLEFLSHMQHLFAYLYKRLGSYQIESVMIQIMKYEMFMLLRVGINNVYRANKNNKIRFIIEVLNYNKKLIKNDVFYSHIVKCIPYILDFDKKEKNIIIAIKCKKVIRAAVYEIF